MLPTNLTRNFSASFTFRPYLPVAVIGIIALYCGSIKRMGDVFQSIVNICVLLTNQTSARNGLFPPNGIPYKLRRRGRFSVSSVYLPGPNLLKICPFAKKIASCDSLTTSCVAVLRFVCGNFHAKISLDCGFHRTRSMKAIHTTLSIFSST